MRISSIGLLAAVALGACSDAKPPRRVEAGMECVQRAVVASLPGAAEAPMPVAQFSENFPGVGAGGGDGRVFGSLTRTACFDWTPLIANAPSGIAGLVLDQAQAHARVLAECGFVPLDAGATVVDSKGAPDEFAVAVVHGLVGSGGSHGWSAPRDVDRLVHRRIYHAPGSGAFVVARIDYDGGTHIACSEMTYVEATVDADYPELGVKFSETLSPMPRKR